MTVSSYHLRPAQVKDAASIRRLIWQVHINPTGLDWHHFWVAVDAQDSLLGCGQLKPHGDGSLELASIAVQPQQRGKGIARATNCYLRPGARCICAARLRCSLFMKYLIFR